jgi:hypothetical protein
MIQEQLDEIQIGAIPIPASIVQWRTSIDAVSRFYQLLSLNTLILNREFLVPCFDRSFLPTDEAVWSLYHRVRS